VGMALRKCSAEYSILPSDKLRRKEVMAEAEDVRLQRGNTCADPDGIGLHSQRKLPYLTGSPLLYDSTLIEKVQSGKLQVEIPHDWIEAAAVYGLTMLAMDDAEDSEASTWVQLQREVVGGGSILNHVKAVLHHRCHTTKFMCSSILSLSRLQAQGRSLCSSFLLARPDEHNVDDIGAYCAIGYVRLDWQHEGRTTCQKLALVQAVECISDPDEARVFGQPVMSFKFPEDCPVNESPHVMPVDRLKRPLILITEKRDDPQGLWRLIQYEGKGLGRMYGNTADE
jgi:hypothetical protein